MSVAVENYACLVIDQYDQNELVRRGVSASAMKQSIGGWRIQNDKRLSDPEWPVNKPTFKVQIEKALADGLLVNGEQATIMLFRNRDWGQLEAKYMQGYKGMIALAMRTGQVKSIVCEVHYENDPEWELHLGSSPRIVHQPFLGRKKDRGELLGSYAVLNLCNGEQTIEWVGVDDLEAMQEVAEKGGRKSDTWGGAFADEMRKKSALRRAFKRTYMDSELDLSMARYDTAVVPTPESAAPVSANEVKELEAAAGLQPAEPAQEPQQQTQPEPERTDVEVPGPAPTRGKSALARGLANGNGKSSVGTEPPPPTDADRIF
jgi:recombinational DNA repair protein RecT